MRVLLFLCFSEQKIRLYNHQQENFKEKLQHPVVYLHCLVATEDLNTFTGGRSTFQDQTIIIATEMLILEVHLLEHGVLQISKNTDVKKKKNNTQDNSVKKKEL